MIDAWMVTRKEKHIDDRFWVCFQKDDALKIAADVIAYWREKYEPGPDQIDEMLYGDQALHFDAEDCFSVVVHAQVVREPGEVTAMEGKACLD
jgi:hypothetical protein